MVEEIFVNMVNYSQCNYLNVDVELNNKRVQLDFDDGLNFNPLEKEDHIAQNEMRQIGPSGIHLLKIWQMNSIMNIKITKII